MNDMVAPYGHCQRCGTALVVLGNFVRCRECLPVSALTRGELKKLILEIIAEAGL